MKIAIASGKGGTGKTTVSAALAQVWPQPVVAVDLDVEEPNLHLFLKPDLSHTCKAYIDVPIIDETRCTYCRACAEHCQFKAISILGSVTMVFSDMCHGCGGCMAICPEQAIGTGQRELGDIDHGKAGVIDFLMGRLRVGEAMSPPLMRMVRGRMGEMVEASGNDVIIDSPPGVSCPAVNAVMDTDYIVLVTEPTPFGLFDLRLAHEAFSGMQIPMAVVINRSDVGDSGVEDYCRKQGLAVLARIPYHRDIARAYAQGQVITQAAPWVQGLFGDLAAKIRQRAAKPEEAENA